MAPEARLPSVGQAWGYQTPRLSSGNGPSFYSLRASLPTTVPLFSHLRLPQAELLGMLAPCPPCLCDLPIPLSPTLWDCGRLTPVSLTFISSLLSGYQGGCPKNWFLVHTVPGSQLSLRHGERETWISISLLTLQICKSYSLTKTTNPRLPTEALRTRCLVL